MLIQRLTCQFAKVGNLYIYIYNCLSTLIENVSIMSGEVALCHTDFLVVILVYMPPTKLTENRRSVFIIAIVHTLGD